MILDLPEYRFDKLSNEAKKRHIVNLIIKDSGAKPVPTDFPPIAVVMAGVPGAGKTEFLDAYVEMKDMATDGASGDFVRIDLDQIVTIYPGYTPKTYAKFRSQGNNVLARCIDVLREQRYNMMIDGTFSGASGSSIRNIEKLLNAGYKVSMIYMYDKPEIAWKYTQLREKETERGIEKDGFITSCKNISVNIQQALLQFKDNTNFRLSVVKQKELRDKNYEFITDERGIDILASEGYNIDKLKEIL